MLLMFLFLLISSCSSSWDWSRWRTCFLGAVVSDTGLSGQEHSARKNVQLILVFSLYYNGGTFAHEYVYTNCLCGCVILYVCSGVHTCWLFTARTLHKNTIATQTPLTWGQVHSEVLSLFIQCFYSAWKVRDWDRQLASHSCAVHNAVFSSLTQCLYSACSAVWWLASHSWVTRCLSPCPRNNRHTSRPTKKVLQDDKLGCNHELHFFVLNNLIEVKRTISRHN